VICEPTRRHGVSDTRGSLEERQGIRTDGVGRGRLSSDGIGTGADGGVLWTKHKATSSTQTPEIASNPVREPRVLSSR